MLLQACSGCITCTVDCRPDDSSRLMGHMSIHNACYCNVSVRLQNIMYMNEVVGLLEREKPPEITWNNHLCSHNEKQTATSVCML